MSRHREEYYGTDPIKDAEIINKKKMMKELKIVEKKENLFKMDDALLQYDQIENEKKKYDVFS
jgi:hypothetical protein